MKVKKSKKICHMIYFKSQRKKLVLYQKIESMIFPRFFFKNGEHPMSLEIARKWTCKGREHYGQKLQKSLFIHYEKKSTKNI